MIIIYIIVLVISAYDLFCRSSDDYHLNLNWNYLEGYGINSPLIRLVIQILTS